MKKVGISILIMSIFFLLCACGKTEEQQDALFGGSSISQEKDMVKTQKENNVKRDTTENGAADESERLISPDSMPEDFVLISGGTFWMGSPAEEAWRSEDETQHTVTVSDFYMSIYELTQAEYQEIMGENPSSFSGDGLPVENISWLDAIRYCNTRSEREGLTPAYTIDGQSVLWDRGQTDTGCLLRQSGNMPAVQERKRRSTQKIPSVRKKQTITDIIHTRLRTITLHRGT